MARSKRNRLTNLLCRMNIADQLDRHFTAMGAQAWLCSGGRGAQVPFLDAGGAADAEPRRYPRRRGAKTWGAKAGPRRGPKGPRTRGLNFSGGRTDPAFRFPGTGDRKLASGRRWNFCAGDSPTRWISPYGAVLGGPCQRGTIRALPGVFFGRKNTKKTP